MNTIIFFFISSMIIYTIKKLSKYNFRHSVYWYVYSIIYLFIGLEYYTIFSGGSSFLFTWGVIPDFRDNGIVKLSSIAITIILLLFCFPKYPSSKKTVIDDKLHIKKLIIKTKLTFQELLKHILEICIISFFNGFLLLGLIISSIFKYFYETNSNIQLVFIPITVSFVTVIVLSIARYKKYNRQDIWELNNNILSRGKPINYTIDLSKVEKIILGRPRKKTKDYLFFNKNKSDLYSSINDGTLTIKIDKKTYLPLYLHNIGNGDLIMDSLVNILEDKFTIDYKFNFKECCALRFTNRNKIIIIDEKNII